MTKCRKQVGCDGRYALRHYDVVFRQQQVTKWPAPLRFIFHKRSINQIIVFRYVGVHQTLLQTTRNNPQRKKRTNRCLRIYGCSLRCYLMHDPICEADNFKVKALHQKVCFYFFYNMKVQNITFACNERKIDEEIREQQQQLACCQLHLRPAT